MISKVVCAQLSFPLGVQMISAPFPQISLLTQSSHTPQPGAGRSTELPLPPSSFHLAYPWLTSAPEVCGSQELREEGSWPPQSQPRQGALEPSGQWGGSV